MADSDFLFDNNFFIDDFFESDFPKRREILELFWDLILDFYKEKYGEGLYRISMYVGRFIYVS